MGNINCWNLLKPRRFFFYKNMDKLKQEKINMWKEKLEDLEKKLEQTMQEKGEAASMGDLSENAAYKMALEEADTLQARIDEVRKIISDLEVN